MPIAFDIDGVISNTEPIFDREIFKKTGHDISGTYNTFYIEVPGVDPKDVTNMITTSILECSEDIKPWPDALVGLKQIYAKTKVMPLFLTARPKILEDVTRWWLDKHIKCPYVLMFRRGADKGPYLKSKGYNVFVEDRLRTANQLSKHISSIFLVNRPWNKDRDTEWNVIRVDGMIEVADKYLNGYLDNRARQEKLGAGAKSL